MNRFLNSLLRIAVPIAVPIAMPTAGLILGLIAAPPSNAETDVRFGAGNRFERIATRHDLIRGLEANETARFHEQLGALADMFEAMPWVADPPNGLCARLTISPQPEVRPTLNATRAMATGSVSVLQPAGFDGQRCTDLTNNGVTLAFNSFSGIFDTGEDIVLAGQTFYAHPVIERQQGGLTVFADGSMLIAREGASIFRPVTKARYLEALAEELESAYEGEQASAVDVDEGGLDYERWLREEKPLLIEENEAMLAEMAGYLAEGELADLRRSLEEVLQATEEGLRAAEAERAGMQEDVDRAETRQSHELAEVRRQLAALTPAQRDLPACVTDDPFSAGPDRCRDGTMIVEFDPGFFDDAASAADLRLIRVSPGIGGLARFRSESPQAFEQRHGIYRSIDVELLQAMID